MDVATSHYTVQYAWLELGGDSIALVGEPRQARLEVGEHDLERRGPALVAVERERDLAPVDLVPLDLVRQLEGGLHAVARVLLRRKLRKLRQARQEPRHGPVVLVAGQDVHGPVQLVRVAPRVHHLGEAPQGLQRVRLERELAGVRHGAEQQARHAPGGVDLVPLHRHGGQAPQPEAVDGAEGAVEPDVERVVVHVGAPQPLQLPHGLLDVDHQPVALLHVALQRQL
eukprot:CAMPEP_0197594382 /NCGR_PEP_ID=MMETSP1326-20131121/20421_1 /TAXON_ID=1155430 /ORGANISM="Genus nov. species nov., Strain RCC2288" /LENGTH=226 /DNA_ID=CAMNT_0043160545 /DNA_START=158 /DNA_END=835 /DNA_ORIENTATION=+